MSNFLTKLRIKNYRSLADVSVDVGKLNILFGPNGAGKSVFLDTIWFVRDCAIRSVDTASSTRSHGIGILYDKAGDDDQISVTLFTDKVEYELRFGLSSGRIEPYAGERLYSVRRNVSLLDRKVGSDKAQFYHINMQESVLVPLREPEKLSLTRYLSFDEAVDEVSQLDRLLHRVHFYHSRSFLLHRIRQQGSEVSHETWLRERGENLWSVLRNLHDRRSIDNRFNTITEFMTRTFPGFSDLLIEQTGPAAVYGSFLERGREQPILASGVSDGHLQMLLLLTSLFSEGQSQESVIILDEPEISLHPWALAVLAEAVMAATNEWGKQVFIATHSPVLISQFSPENILAAEMKDGRTQLYRLSEMDGIQDLLEQYAAGTLYMADIIAPQGPAAYNQGQK